MKPKFTTLTPTDTSCIASFTDGLVLGRTPTPKNTEKAIMAVTRKTTTPEDRAKWTGYLCTCGDVDP